MKQFPFVSDLSSPDTIKTFTGPIQSLEKTLLPGGGYTSSVIEKIIVVSTNGSKHSFILKHTNLRHDWLAQRSGDSMGRESAFLENISLFKIWKSFHCPYLAFANEKDQTGLLMEDLSAYLFPDVREPINIDTEKIILNTLASFHAEYWASPEIEQLEFLVKPWQYLEMLSPGVHFTDSIASPPAALADSMKQGWEIAMNLLTEEIRSLMIMPSAAAFGNWSDLPNTLLHGDVKIANMALMPKGKISTFDWTTIGFGPCSMDLGWYLAVNSTRLARSKEAVMSIYKSFLDTHLKFPLEEKIWSKIIDLAVFTGAKMLLWSKGLTFRSNPERGVPEFSWWQKQLERVVSNLG